MKRRHASPPLLDTPLSTLLSQERGLLGGCSRVSPRLPDSSLCVRGVTEQRRAINNLMGRPAQRSGDQLEVIVFWMWVIREAAFLAVKGCCSVVVVTVRSLRNLPAFPDFCISSDSVTSPWGTNCISELYLNSAYILHTVINPFATPSDCRSVCVCPPV